MRAPRRPVHLVAAAAVAGTLGAGAAVALAAGGGAAGDLDPSFASGGIQQVGALDDGNDVDLAILPDGRLQTGGRGRALRLLPDGSPDPSFGAFGVAPIPPALVNAAGVAVDGQGRTLIAGSYQPGGQVDRTALLRLSPDGTPDGSFGGDGIVDVEVAPGLSESGLTVLVRSDGKYDVVGEVGFVDDGNKRPFVLQLKADGTPDPSFAGDGSLVFGPARTRVGRAVLSGSDVLVSAYEQPASSTTPAAGLVARVRADGTLDPTFSGDGIASSPAQVGLTTGDVVVLPDGRIRQVGSTSSEGAPSGSRGVLSGFTADGSPDTAVGPGGQRSYDVVPGTGTILSAMTRSGDRLVVAGDANARAEGGALRVDSLVGRLSLDGAPDPTFSGDGFATRAEGSALAFATRVLADGAGRLVTAGFVVTDFPTGKISTRIARYLAADQPATPSATTTASPTTTVTVPGPTVTVPAATPPAATPPTAASVLRLPGASKCVSRRTVRLTVKAPAGRTIKKLTAKVGSAKAKTVKAPVTLSLKGRPKGKVKVLVTATLSDGSTLKRTVTYTLCAKTKAKR